MSVAGRSGSSIRWTVFLWLLGLTALWTSRAFPAPILPIYLEDCHAGSFYQLAQTLDLDQPYTLLHFDAHSDANAIFSSDEVRTALRQVANVGERTRRLEAWRKAGTIQCFNWIEPLMPRPFERVVWIPAEQLSPVDQAARQSEARAYLDGHEEVAPRGCGSLANRYEVRSFADLRAQAPERWSGGLPVVASVDLDYFAALPDEQLPAAFERVFAYLLTLDRLQVITFAVSTPYLKTQAQAQRLVGLAMEAALSVDNANVRFEPFARTGPDRSRAMRILAAQGQSLPVFDVAAASPDLRALCVQQRARVHPQTDTERFSDLLDGWEADLRRWNITVAAEDQQGPDPDGCWRLPDPSKFTVGFPPESVSGSGKVRVRWLAAQTAAAEYNVVEGSAANLFAAGASRFIRRTSRLVRQDDGLDKPLTDADLRPFFDPATGLGSLRLSAEVEREDGSRVVTNTLSLCRVRATGFLAGLSEQFNRPYVYGSGLLQASDGATGPDTGIGADCTNFLIAGLRRDGWQVPWGNPAQFRRQLESCATGAVCLGPDGQAHGEDTKVVSLSDADLTRGVFMDFGTHMAALWEDREPRGVLDGNDLVVHQLEGRPEILPLRELLSRRSSPNFRVERLRTAPVACRVVFGGDVMLAARPGEEEEAIWPLVSELKTANLTVVNLECAITDQGKPAPGKAITLRAAPLSVTRLRAAGVGAVSVANNHAGDFGSAGFLDMLDRLDQAGIKWFGGGRTQAGAYEACTVQAGPLRVALVGYSDADTGLLPARDSTGGIAVSDEWPTVLAAVRGARERGADFVAVMPHWGRENTTEVEDRQREQARDLIQAGADLVVGSGPHRVQRQEEVDGQPVVYSLGNLVFDGGKTAAGWWSRGELLEVSLDQKGQILRTRAIPVTLAGDASGRPECRNIANGN